MNVYLKNTDYHVGYGVFAARDFRRGELVIRATGPVLPYQSMHSIQIDWDRHMKVGSPARYLNHSCDPNLGVRSCNARGVEFVALRDIQAGEEVTFDYAMTEYRHYPRPDPNDEFDLTCHCGSPNCRGRLGYYSELSDELKVKYRGFIAEYLVRREARSGVATRPGTGPLVG
ncbi:MAG: SET domain-containing protein-lysine N-methyltransferase [Anaerolineales bacterium]|nr:SET domain-containing protein-lysine N-methyltransferase [Anaerolineales bacterium]